MSVTTANSFLCTRVSLAEQIDADEETHLQNRAASISVENVSWSVKSSRKKVLYPISFALAPGKVLGVVGPNGAGKSTLLRLLYRFHEPTSGSVKVDGKDIWSLSSRAVAQKVAAVLQEQPSDLSLTVGEIVALGRTPHRKGF